MVDFDKSQKIILNNQGVFNVQFYTKYAILNTFLQFERKNYAILKFSVYWREDT